MWRLTKSLLSYFLAHIEEAEAGEAGFFEEIAFEVLLFQHGELVGGHLAAIGAELAVEFRAGLRAADSSVCASAGGGDHLLFEHGEALLEGFEVGVMLLDLGGQIAQGSGDLGVTGRERVGIALPGRRAVLRAEKGGAVSRRARGCAVRP